MKAVKMLVLAVAATFAASSAFANPLFENSDAGGTVSTGASAVGSNPVVGSYGGFTVSAQTWGTQVNARGMVDTGGNGYGPGMISVSGGTSSSGIAMVVPFGSLSQATTTSSVGVNAIGSNVYAAGTANGAANAAAIRTMFPSYTD